MRTLAILLDPHQGAAYATKCPALRPSVVATVLKVAVEPAMRKVELTVCVEIHDAEGDFAYVFDLAERGVEFDAVEYALRTHRAA